MTKKLGEILVEDGRLTDAQLQKALKAQLIFGGHLGTSLIELGYLDEETLGETLSRSFGVPYATIDILQNIPYSVIRAIPAKLVEKYKVVPIRLDGRTLQLAMMDPKNLMALDEISFVTGYRIDPWVAPEIRIYQVLEKYYNIPRSQRYITLARELGKLRSRGERIHASGAQLDDSGDWPARAGRATAPAQAGGAGPDGEAETAPVARPASMDTGPMPAVAPGRAATDHWEKYGYGKSWREYADAMERKPAAPDPVTVDTAESPKAAGVGTSAEEQIADAGRRLAACTSPDEVAETILSFASRWLKRSAFFVVRGETAVGWGGTGEGFTAARLTGTSLPIVRDSIFALVEDGREHYRGTLPAFPSIRRLFQDIGVPMPRTALLLPIRIKDKTASYLYGDNGPEEDLPASHAELFERLAQKASLALQMIIFRNKILAP